MELKEAIEARDPSRVRATLGKADKLVGPHFKFEEHDLYPRLTEFLGEARVQKLLTEHDGVFRGVAAERMEEKRRQGATLQEYRRERMQ